MVKKKVPRNNQRSTFPHTTARHLSGEHRLNPFRDSHLVDAQGIEPWSYAESAKMNYMLSQAIRPPK